MGRCLICVSQIQFHFLCNPYSSKGAHQRYHDKLKIPLSKHETSVHQHTGTAAVFGHSQFTCTMMIPPSAHSWFHTQNLNRKKKGSPLQNGISCYCCWSFFSTWSSSDLFPFTRSPLICQPQMILKKKKKREPSAGLRRGLGSACTVTPLLR